MNTKDKLKFSLLKRALAAVTLNTSFSRMFASLR